jgi:Spy/CpxP family protein refolding chaperone
MMRTSCTLLLPVALVILLFAPAGAEPPYGAPPRGMVGHAGMMGPPAFLESTGGEGGVIISGHAGMMGPPAFLEHVFPPELVMRYQGELDLTPAQQEAMTRVMAETQAKLVELQWKFEGAMQALTKMLEKDTVDEEAILAQWDQLSAVEQQIKKAHLSLLLRIKNQLTPSQQEKLRALQPARPGPSFHRGPEVRPGPPPPRGPED